MSGRHLSDLLDLTILQKLADTHYQAAGMPIGIIDAIDKSILVGSGWQDICVKFHRSHPVALQRCRESDNYIKERLIQGEVFQYKCKNELWDIGMPILVGGEHLATVFLGQFFYEGEVPDREFFRQQAHQFGFDVDDYLAALDRVPTFSRQKVDHILEYNKTLVSFIADLAENALSRIKTNEIIRENERKFHAIFDQSYGLLTLLSVDGRVLKANRTALAFSDISEADVTGKLFWKTPWWAHSPELRKRLRLAVPKAAKGNLVQFETTHVAVDGNLHHFGFSLKPVTDESGEVILLTAEARDIAERKAAEQTVRENEQQLRQARDLLEAVTTGTKVLIATVDRDLRYTFFNHEHHEELRRLTGKDAVIGMSLMEALSDMPEERDKAMALWSRALNGETVTQTIMFGDSGNYKRWYSTRHTPILGATGQIIGAGEVASDITERKQMEKELRKSRHELELRVQERTQELRQTYQRILKETEQRNSLEERLRQVYKMEAIGTLAGGIAHDFNNLLAAIIGFTEMVQEDLPPESKNKVRMQRVLRAAFRGRDLVRQILTFSRKAKPPRALVSLSSVVEETVRLLRASLPSTIKLKLTRQVAKDTVIASPAEVRQILMNLATNASYAMREKGGALSIGMTNIDFESDFPVLDEEAEPGEYVLLTVTDTGVGIEPDIMKRVFDPFFTTKGAGEGSGMGLAVVHGIVKSLHGGIVVESQPGVGSAFRVFLPVAQTDEKAPDREAQTIPGGSERILFVDDEEMLAELGQAVLGNLGYSVTALTDSTEALKVFSADPSRFDLVILDQTMPKLTGLHLAKKLLGIRNDIPIILCTDHSDSVSLEKAKKAGITKFLTKPLEKRELAEAIHRVLGETRDRG
jgi:PAS domain S-box-containing protein